VGDQGYYDTIFLVSSTDPVDSETSASLPKYPFEESFAAGIPDVSTARSISQTKI